MSSSIYVTDSNGNIAAINPSTLAVDIIGNAGVQLTDIGFAPDGQLYGISFTNLYSINPTTGQATNIGSLGTTGMNALAFDSNGVAYAYGSPSDNLYTVNLTTGLATPLKASSSVSSAGDLTFYQGNLLLSTLGDQLVTLNPANGAVIQTVSGTQNNLFGLAATDPDHLYSFAGTTMYLLDASTGASVPVAQLAGSGLGTINGAACDGYFQAPIQTPGSNVTVTLPDGPQNYVAAAGDVVQAGSGNDTITASAGDVTVLGGAGQLIFIGGTAASSVFGGLGTATLYGGAGGGQFIGGTAGGNILVSQGNAGVTTLIDGSAAGDEIFGSASGNDVLNAGQGKESIIGGGGNTTITGGSSADVIFAGTGSTTVNGGTGGGDTIVGGAGPLSVAAQNGDAIFGGTGILSLSGSTSGADSIIGGAGALTVTGQGANMLVVGGSGSSNVTTGSGASLVFAGSGNLSLTGGAGSMQVLAGLGSIHITEGAGPLTMQAVSGTSGGMDIISGFRPGTDVVQLYGYQASQQQVTVVSGSTVISLSNGPQITLLGVTDPGHSIIG